MYFGNSSNWLTRAEGAKRYGGRENLLPGEELKPIFLQRESYHFGDWAGVLDNGRAKDFGLLFRLEMRG